MKRKAIILSSIVFALIFSACGRDNVLDESEAMTESISNTTTASSDSGFDMDSSESQTAMISNSESTAESNTIEQYQGMIDEAYYLDKDQLFLLKLTNGNQILVELDGRCSSKDLGDLQSRYLGLSSLNDLKDIYGVVQSFSDDPDALYSYHAVASTPYGDIIWVQTETSDINGTTSTLTAYDEWGNEIYKLDSNNPIFSESGRSKDDLRNSVGDGCNGVSYRGDGIFGVANLLINIDTGEIFADYGEDFNEGYSISVEGIRDTHGQFVIDATSSPAFQEIVNDDSIFTQFYNGLFYESVSQKFYDINLNCIIDLSQYDIISEDLKFNDNLCAVRLKNPDKVALYGIIDKNGDWVFEPSDDTDLPNFYPYNGRLSINKIELGSAYNIAYNKIYDLESQDFIFTPIYGDEVANLGGYCFFLSSGELRCYDIEDEKECEFPSVDDINKRVDEFSAICS